MVDLKQTLTDIAKAIVDHPEEVAVTLTNDTENSIRLQLSVAPSDMGKVIGKHGKIAKSIRQIMKSAASGSGKKINVDIE